MDARSQVLDVQSQFEGTEDPACPSHSLDPTSVPLEARGRLIHNSTTSKGCFDAPQPYELVLHGI